MPASFVGQVKPVKIEIAPPCEKPPIGSQCSQHCVLGLFRYSKPPTKNNAGRRNAFFVFAFDECIEILAGSQNAGFIVGLSEIAECGLRPT